MAEEKQPDPPPATDARPSDRVLSKDDVKDVLTITLERAKEANDKSLAALRESTERLLNESEATRDMVQRLSQLPPKTNEEK